MSRSSPGVTRVAAILNFIADHPGQAFALTDLVRALKLSRATCHALLTGLVDVGYLYRTSEKTYVLGPALGAIGRIAAEHFSPLQIAQPEMRRLADEFDVVCGAYFLERDTIHLRDRAASVSHVGYPVPLGTRMTLHWTQAIAFFARAPKAAESWLARKDPPLRPDQADRLERGMAFVRERGFVLHVRKPGFESGPGETYTPPQGDELPIAPQLELDAAASYPVAAVIAPVFDARDTVPFTLVMAGFANSLSGAQALETGARLAATCERISRFMAGEGQASA